MRDDERADQHREVAGAGGAEVARSPRIGTPRAGLQLTQNLAGGDLRGARHRTGRKRRLNHPSRMRLGIDAGAHRGDHLVDAGIALHSAEPLSAQRARYRVHREVVAHQVGNHHVLRPILRVGGQIPRQRLILITGGAPWPGALDGLRPGDPLRGDLQEPLRGGGDEGDAVVVGPWREAQELRERGAISPSQHAVGVKGITVEAAGDCGGQADLVGVAFRDLPLGCTDLLQILSPGVPHLQVLQVHGGRRRLNFRGVQRRKGAADRGGPVMLHALGLCRAGVMVDDDGVGGPEEPCLVLIAQIAHPAQLERTGLPGRVRLRGWPGLPQPGVKALGAPGPEGLGPGAGREGQNAEPAALRGGGAGMVTAVQQRLGLLRKEPAQLREEVRRQILVGALQPKSLAVDRGGHEDHPMVREATATSGPAAWGTSGP